jgi:hypothetical protein
LIFERAAVDEKAGMTLHAVLRALGIALQLLGLL